jgi:VanZ family protein
MRKVIHFSVYFVLAVVLMIFINYLFNNKRYIISFMITLLLYVGFAYSDEYHQTLVEGRTGQYQDVVIDSSGATFGCLAYGTYYLAYFMGRRREQKDIIEKALKKVQREEKVNKSVK